MNLVEDWKKCWKWLSVQANAVGVAMSGAYSFMYDHLKSDLPPKYMVGITGGVFLLGIIGRLISQTPKEPTE